MAEAEPSVARQEAQVDGGDGSSSTARLHHVFEPGAPEPGAAGALSTPGDDPMLGFLTLLAKVERPACANCESKDLSPMFYCNTCGKLRFSRHNLTKSKQCARLPYRASDMRRVQAEHAQCQNVFEARRDQCFSLHERASAEGISTSQSSHDSDVLVTALNY